MAESLRTMLKADFKLATGVHIGQTKPTDFRKTIDANWNWLDGKSLLNTKLNFVAIIEQ
jgi:hypothetical protein